MGDLGERLLNCPAFKWMPGMLGRDGPVTQRVFDEEIPDEIRWIPDTEDPATMGCLLSLARTIYDDHALIIASIDYGPGGVMWQARLTIRGTQLSNRHYNSEAEALVSAIEEYNKRFTGSIDAQI